ncbi:hypothetical protein LMG24076_02233 [Trinickia soli]|uniref:hypothetical protein n=1 Tax=Trinickia soli TaxID=380675 RepID=UPI001468F94B|nr:hypothetical protein LMG24076_02233 [Trinickia soli]
MKSRRSTTAPSRSAATAPARVVWTHCIVAACALLPQAAAAAPNGWQFEVSGATGATTRGIVESDKTPTVGIGASWYPDPGGGFFIGASALTMRSTHFPETGAKIVADAGYMWRIDGDWSIQAIVSRYQFEHVPFAARLGYDEVALRGGWRDTVFASVTASPDTAFGPSPKSRSFSYDIAGRLPLAHGFSATAGIGYYDLRAQLGSGFVYADAGLTYEYGSMQLDLWYIGTRASTQMQAQIGALLAHRWVADVIWHF